MGVLPNVVKTRQCPAYSAVPTAHQDLEVGNVPENIQAVTNKHSCFHHDFTRITTTVALGVRLKKHINQQHSMNSRHPPTVCQGSTNWPTLHEAVTMPNLERCTFSFWFVAVPGDFLRTDFPPIFSIISIHAYFEHGYNEFSIITNTFSRTNFAI